MYDFLHTGLECGLQAQTGMEVDVLSNILPFTAGAKCQ
jgi:hypothetical protein